MSKLDVSVQCHTFELDEKSAKLHTVATPSGLCKNKCLPMGISCAPDIAQEAMERTVEPVEQANACFDDDACFDDTWENHPKPLTKHLQDSKLTDSL